MLHMFKQRFFSLSKSVRAQIEYESENIYCNSDRIQFIYKSCLKALTIIS